MMARSHMRLHLEFLSRFPGCSQMTRQVILLNADSNLHAVWSLHFGWAGWSGLRMKKAHVTHPELKTTFCLDILGVKKNPNGQSYTQLGVITKGTIIEVNVSDLGLVTPGGKVVWGKYAQVTNNPENDGCINAVLLV